MRTATTYILSFTLFFQPSFLLAADPMDMANEAVAASHKQANQMALAAVEEDLAFTLSKAIQKAYTSNVKMTEDGTKQLLTSREDILAGFEALAEMDASELAELKETAQKAYNDYKKLVRSRFDDSFIAPGLRAEARKSIIFAQQTLEEFTRTCKSGRGVTAEGIPAFLVPDLPKPQMSIEFSVGNATTSSFSSDYTATGSQGEKNRNDVMGVTGTVMSINTSIWISGGTSSTAALSAAAGPWILGGGGLIMVGMLYMSHAEKVKAQDKIAAAQVYAFNETANNADIGQYYREHCLNYTARIERINEVLTTALNQPNGLEKLAESFGDIETDLKEFEELTRQYDQAQAELVDLISKKSEKGDATKDEQLQKQLKKIKSISAKISEKSNPKSLAAFMTKVLLDKQVRLQEQLAELSWDAVDVVQKRAFFTIQKTLGFLSQKRFQDMFSEKSDFSKELQAIQKFELAKQLFKQAIAGYVKLGFGRISQKEFDKMANDLKAQTQFLMDTYGFYQPVLDFASNVDSFFARLVD